MYACLDYVSYDESEFRTDIVNDRPMIGRLVEKIIDKEHI